MVKLSILIPSIKRHEKYLSTLLNELVSQTQTYDGEVEILVDYSEIDSIGEKRNRLLGKAEGTHISFFDADDTPTKDYVKWVMEGVDKNVDCCSLKGIITTDGKSPHYFEHSIKYKEYKTNEGTEFNNGDIKYERFPNHISCIKASVAKRFFFPEKNWGEDTDWATKINKSGLLKVEHYIPDVIYNYNYVTDKTK